MPGRTSWTRGSHSQVEVSSGSDFRIQGHALPGDAGAALFGPDGWLDGFAEGELIALRRDGEAFVVEKAEFPEDYEEDESYSDEVLAMMREAKAAAEYDADYGDPSLPGVFGSEIVFRTRLAEPGAFTRPLPPMSGLLEAVGLEVVHGYVGLPGTPWFGEPEWFDDRQREVWRDWSTALAEIRRTGSLPDDEALTTLRSGSARPTWWTSRRWTSRTTTPLLGSPGPWRRR